MEAEYWSPALWTIPPLRVHSVSSSQVMWLPGYREWPFWDIQDSDFKEIYISFVTHTYMCACVFVCVCLYVCEMCVLVHASVSEWQYARSQDNPEKSSFSLHPSNQGLNSGFHTCLKSKYVLLWTIFQARHLTLEAQVHAYDIFAGLSHMGHTFLAFTKLWCSLSFRFGKTLWCNFSLS